MGFNKLSRLIKTGVIHPLIGYNKGALNLCQVRNAVLSQYGDAIRGDQLRNTVVDLLVNMVWTSGQDDTLHMIVTEIFNRFFALIFHILTGFGKLIPGGFNRCLNFLRTDIRCLTKLLSHSLNNMFFIIQGKEGIHKLNMFGFQLLHIVFNIFRIRSNNWTVVMIIGTFHLVPLIRNAWIEDKIHAFFNEPHNMSVD